MWKHVSIFSTLIAVSIAKPLLGIAQTTTKPDAPQQPQWTHGHWHMWGDHHHGWHFWWIPLMMIFFFVLFVGALRFFRVGRRWDMMHWPSRNTSASAIEILNERFARGEIDEEEYEDKKTKILSS